MKNFVVNDAHDFTQSPVFIQKSGKLIGMIKRSDFNNLYPVAVDRIADFEGIQLTLRISDIAIYLESKGYNLVVE